jgi:hypothetical protein
VIRGFLAGGGYLTSTVVNLQQFNLSQPEASTHSELRVIFLTSTNGIVTPSSVHDVKSACSLPCSKQDVLAAELAAAAAITNVLSLEPHFLMFRFSRKIRFIWLL